MSGSDKHRGKETRAGTPAAKTAGLDPRDFASLDDALEVLLGRRPGERETRDAAWYHDLREALRLARDDSNLGQKDLAKTLGVVQSEVSRLETSLGHGTRLGRVRDYLEACNATLGVLIKTAAGRARVVGETPAHPGAPLEAEALPFTFGLKPWSGLRVTVDNVALRGRDLHQLIAVLPALDAAMADAGLSAEQAGQIRHRFLERFRQVREADPGMLAQADRAPTQESE